MTKMIARTLSRIFTIVVAFLLAVFVILLAGRLGWLGVFGIQSESHDTQVIKSIERTQEVSLVSLSVQGIKEQKDNRSVAGWGIPGTSKKAYLQYLFDAKLGVDGQQVQVSRDGKSSYRISVPEFMFIGYDEPTFKVAVQDGGLLGWVTPDIDTVEMINEILNDEAKDSYIEKNEELLQEQTKVFYDGLITGIDPSAKTSYEFAG